MSPLELNKCLSVLFFSLKVVCFMPIDRLRIYTMEGFSDVEKVLLC